MEWSASGVVLTARPHGENAVIAELFTRHHGRHLGLVRGGRSRRLRPLLQTGNTVSATWRARLADHLGTFVLEAEIFRAAAVMDDPATLAALSSVCSLAGLVPERQSYEPLYDALVVVLDSLGDNKIWPALVVRWELGLLEMLGYGLDLSRCAGTGATENLVFVSPKSGRAVSAGAGAVYKDKLLALPSFLLGPGATKTPDKNAVMDGFKLTGYFLARHVFQPRGLAMPDARTRMMEYLSTTRGNRSAGG